MQQKKRSIPIVIFAALLLFFFAFVSVIKLDTSYTIYMVSQERMHHAELEHAYVSKWLKNLQKSRLQREHSAEHFDSAGDTLRKIEIRGDAALPEDDRPFSQDGTHFNVIPQ